jgi:hypothetical protein
VEDGSHGRERRVQPEQQRDESEVADGRVGQQPLEVVRNTAAQAPKTKVASADALDDPEPLLAAGERRVQAAASRKMPAFTIVAECR